MKKNKKFSLSIRAKLVLTLGLLILIIFAASGGIVISRVGNSSRGQAIQYMEALSSQYAEIAEGIINPAFSALDATAGFLSNTIGLPPELQGTITSEFLRDLMESRQGFTSLWIVWEPSFLPPDTNPELQGLMFYRNGATLQRINQPIAQMLQDPSYLRTRQTREPVLTEPFTKTLMGNDLYLISLVVPILDNGRFIGAVGADILPETFARELNTLSLFETGFGRLISNSGQVVSHPFANRIGQQAPEWVDETFQPKLVELRNGNIQTFESLSLATGQVSIKAFIPVYFDTIEQPWFYGTVVPPQEIYRETQTILIWNIITVLTGSIIAVLITILVVTALLKPLQQARDALKMVSQGEGDLTQKISIRNQDEVGRLAEYFNRFTEHLSFIIRSIKTSLEDLDQVSQGLSSSMSQASSAVYQINANIDSVNNQVTIQETGIHGVSNAIQDITLHIKNLDNLLTNQQEALETSSAAIEQMVANIQSMTQNIDSNTQEIVALESISEKGYTELEEVTQLIREISQQSEGMLETNTVIQSIASQTNLLAMNAAIEAAHAGEAGKGFAVVADEVRKLAEGASNQSNSISQVLQSLKDLIDRVVHSVTEAGTSFDQVRSSVKASSRRQLEIRSAMEEQNSGSKSILDNVVQLRTITVDVLRSAEKITDGRKTIEGEMNGLILVSKEIQQGMKEMSQGTLDINNAVAHVVELSETNQGSVKKVESEVKKFIID